MFPVVSRFPDFYMAGGTALALQIGHRISVDFDLFSDKDIPRSLLKKVEDACHGFAVQSLVNDKGELTVLAGGVKFTFLSYSFPLLESLVEHDGVRLLSVREIAATKAYTLGRRGAFKDYVDLYFVLTEGHATLPDIIGMAEKKYGDAFNARLLLEQLLFMDDVPDDAISYTGPSLSRTQIAETLAKYVQTYRLSA